MVETGLTGPSVEEISVEFYRLNHDVFLQHATPQIHERCYFATLRFLPLSRKPRLLPHGTLFSRRCQRFGIASA